MSGRKPGDEDVRGMRSLLVVVVLTVGALFLVDVFSAPRGHPLLHAIALSWLVALTAALASQGTFFSMNPRLFSPAHWENEGELYNRTGVTAFQWALVHRLAGSTRTYVCAPVTPISSSC